MIDPEWGEKTTARMKKVDARIASARPGASWNELLGPEDDEIHQVPVATKKKYAN